MCLAQKENTLIGNNVPSAILDDRLDLLPNFIEFYFLCKSRGESKKYTHLP